jgi:hypothetical protein
MTWCALYMVAKGADCDQPPQPFESFLDREIKGKEWGSVQQSLKSLFDVAKRCGDMEAEQLVSEALAGKPGNPTGNNQYKKNGGKNANSILSKAMKGSNQRI